MSFIFERCYVDKDKEDEMGWTDSANVGEEKCLRSLVRQPVQYVLLCEVPLLSVFLLSLY